MHKDEYYITIELTRYMRKTKRHNDFVIVMIYMIKDLCLCSFWHNGLALFFNVILRHKKLLRYQILVGDKMFSFNTETLSSNKYGKEIPKGKLFDFSFEELWTKLWLTETLNLTRKHCRIRDMVLNRPYK